MYESREKARKTQWTSILNDINRCHIPMKTSKHPFTSCFRRLLIILLTAFIPGAYPHKKGINDKLNHPGLCKRRTLNIPYNLSVNIIMY